jgi:hypothetical protein
LPPDGDKEAEPQSTPATATTPAPIVQMRYSDDGAQTWTSWIPGYIGMAGDHNYKASWRSLGIMQQPGRYFEFRISDPVITAIQGATMNEARI